MLVQLNRIDASGVFALPDGVTFNNVRALYHNGEQISPEMGNCVIVTDQNVDVWYSNMDSVVVADIIE